MMHVDVTIAKKPIKSQTSVDYELKTLTAKSGVSAFQLKLLIIESDLEF